VVCTLPAAVALKASFPGCEITWCVDRRFVGVVELCSAVDRAVAWPKSRPDRKAAMARLGEFDAAFDLQGLFKSGVIVGMAKAGRKLGYHWRREGAWLFSRRVVPDPSSLHVTDQYVDVVRAFGAQCGTAEFGLKPLPEDAARVNSMLPTGGIVVCNAGAGWSTKRWPAAHFATLASRLHERGVRVAFIGAESDRPAFEEVRRAGAPNALDLVGRTTVKELVALLSVAKAHVGGDTGSTHIAAALGVPAIGLYSLTRPERSCPYGQRHNTLYDAQGLERIGPDRVLKALDAAIRQNG
jgi:ADP-heptose:LPS heptosyltransferase